MSLAAAVTEIAAAMGKDVEDPVTKALSPESLWLLLRTYQQQLCVALKAAAGEPRPADPLLTAVDDSTRRLAVAAAARLERDLKREDTVDLGRWVSCVGGRADGTNFTLVGAVPEGAWVPVCGQAYQFRGGVLYYDEAETRRLAAQQPR